MEIIGLQNQIDANMYQSTKLKDAAKNVSQNSSDDELMQVCKDFTSYFIEEVVREMKENMTTEEDETPFATLTDYHMDGVIEKLSDTVLEQSGMSFTQQLYEQMKRNYGIE